MLQHGFNTTNMDLDDVHVDRRTKEAHVELGVQQAIQMQKESSLKGRSKSEFMVDYLKNNSDPTSVLSKKNLEKWQRLEGIKDERAEEELLKPKNKRKKSLNDSEKEILKALQEEKLAKRQLRNMELQEQGLEPSFSEEDKESKKDEEDLDLFKEASLEETGHESRA